MAKSLALALLVAISCLSGAAAAYRFTCNSLDSNGESNSDECGRCNLASAARWNPSSITIKTDFTTLPSSLSSSAWAAILERGLNSWNSIPGSSLRMSLVQQSNSRSFGGEPGSHAIFWITDPKEWRRVVGGGEYSTLGLTIAPYSCSTDSTGPREIFDADLVMNGTGHFKWEKSCNSINSSCSSIINTLVHELGHVAGLGHPCLHGTSSVMCAVAGANIEFPLADDQAGIRALYPLTSGEIGSPCSAELPCQHNLFCTTQAGSAYCSSACAEDTQCPSGMSCGHGDHRRCIFTRGWLAPPAILGEKCRDRPCADALVCAGSDPNFYCFEPCSDDGRCPKGNQVCKGLPGKPGACVVMASLGETCSEITLCPGGNICIKTSISESGRCRASCSPNQKQGSCPDREYCAPFELSGVCLPLGLKLELSASAESKSGSSKTGPHPTSYGCTCASLPGQSSGLQLYIFGALWYIGYALTNWARKRRVSTAPPSIK